MHCLFSSIAWGLEQSDRISDVLRDNGADGIEASPRLFDHNFSSLAKDNIQRVRLYWESRGLPIRSMQSLLFGMPKLRLFASYAERQVLAAYLRLVFQVAGQLGAGPLVFGSPKNRSRYGMKPSQAFAVATEFFKTIARDAHKAGCTLCIEANAAAYGCDFITTHAEAIALVQAVDTPGFGLQIDTGVMQINNEAPEHIVDILYKKNIIPEHIHISEPFLAPVNAKTQFHKKFSVAIHEFGYNKNISIEMKTPTQDDLYTTIIKSLDTCLDIYGDK